MFAKLKQKTIEEKAKSPSPKGTHQEVRTFGPLIGEGVVVTLRGWMYTMLLYCTVLYTVLYYVHTVHVYSTVYILCTCTS